MKVKYKSSGEVFTVYDITYDNDDAYFLIFDGGMFDLYSAEFFEPTEEDIISDGRVSSGIFDQEEIHRNCTVQIWRNSVTGEVSFGWWKEEKDD